MSLTLAQAAKIIEAALHKARELKLKPVGVAVLDARGVLVAFSGEDGGGLFRPDIARAKAYGCLGFNSGGRPLAVRAAKQPEFAAAISEISGGRFAPMPGGALVRGTDGSIIGAVGISGDTSDNDEACTIAAIEAAGLKADAGV
ncbi:GlcG/HbpS family heme-binding protein [Bradyrhizobium prioriisuperbiae]|uniref:GlcG/HbpS family heme-binding protein n=1 Tax=Bradyrhizobium prioriisuperbiae TaxID=2854389 RepID=UPI0028EF04EC|nr:heme-binding protein [Bradyrhizobium prioritasuperba]